MLRAVVPTSVVYAGCAVCGQRVSGKVAVASEGAERVLTPQLASSIVHRTLVYIYARFAVFVEFVTVRADTPEAALCVDALTLASILQRLAFVDVYALCPVDTIATFAAAVRDFPVKVTVLVAPSVVIFAVIFCLWLADIVDS